MPQPAICHGVHGPCPSQKFETNPDSAPTANPGGPPRVKPAIRVMSVVGTTLGIGENATRPATEIAASAATSATVCEGGRERSYQANPPSSVNTRTSIAASPHLIGPAPWSALRRRRPFAEPPLRLRR